MPTETLTPPRPETRLRNEYVQSLTNKTILVTGAGGYVGTALLSSLFSVPCRIHALVHERRCVPVPDDSGATLTSCSIDLSRSGVWLDLLRESQPDIIVNLAAYEHRRGSQHAPE